MRCSAAEVLRGRTMRHATPAMAHPRIAEKNYSMQIKWSRIVGNKYHGSKQVEQCQQPLVSYQPRIAALKSSLWWRAALNRKCQWCSWASSRKVLSTPWRSQTSSVEKRTKWLSKIVPVPIMDYHTALGISLLDGSPMTGRDRSLEAFHVWILVCLLHCQESACQDLVCQVVCPAMRPSHTPDTCAKSFSKGLGRRPITSYTVRKMLIVKW